MSDDSEMDILARTIYGEARGESADGKIAVGCVIVNRAKLGAKYREQKDKRHPLFGNGTLQDAAQRPWQFSCWNSNDPNRDKLMAVQAGDVHFDRCRAAAERAVTGYDITDGATHYHTLQRPNGVKQWPPAWAVGARKTKEIGQHVFYKDVP